MRPTNIIAGLASPAMDRSWKYRESGLFFRMVLLRTSLGQRFAGRRAKGPARTVVVEGNRAWLRVEGAQSARCVWEDYTHVGCGTQAMTVTIWYVGGLHKKKAQRVTQAGLARFGMPGCK
jgi:hypothetical protein